MKGLRFVNDNDIEYKNATETELVVKTCPFCGDDRYKLYVNKEKGLYDCKLCGQQGNIYQLQAKYGTLDQIGQPDILRKKYKPMNSALADKAVTELSNNTIALEYLHDRGFTDETIKFFKLGVQDEWLLIPHFFEKDLWNFKMRTYEGEKRFKRVVGQPTVLFNADNLDYSKKAIVIVESETDCMAAWQMGVKNVVAITGGAKTFVPEWLKTFNKFKQVFICLNSDEPGQKGTEKLAEKIGYPKSLNVILPCKDVNDYLKEGRDKKMSFNEYLKTNATKFSIKNVSKVSDYVEKIDDWFDTDGSLSGLQLEGFPKLNKIINGFKAEDLIILLGDSGVGKTTWVLNAVLQMLKDDRRCLLFCLEGKINYYILRMMCIHKNITMEKLREDEREWEVLKDEFAEFPLYFYSGPQVDMDPKKLTEMLPSAVKLYDIEFVALDNLQKFVKGYADVFQRTGDAVSVLKDLCVDLKIPILLISHVKKLDGKSKHNITMHDAKSSSTIYQDADMLLIINVKQNGSYEMVVEKNRMGEGGMRLPITLDKPTARYFESGDIDSAPAPVAATVYDTIPESEESLS